MTLALGVVTWWYVVVNVVIRLGSTWFHSDAILGSLVSNLGSILKPISFILTTLDSIYVISWLHLGPIWASCWGHLFFPCPREGKVLLKGLPGDPLGSLWPPREALGPPLGLLWPPRAPPWIPRGHLWAHFGPPWSIKKNKKRKKNV